MTTQWHPLFAHLLRPLVESHYEVHTNLTVGDAPREADLALLRRTADAPPFVGLWRRLSVWNVLEFKGPTESARVADLDLLIELGLGIDRRLNEERRKKKEPEVERAEVSFWYLANHLGRRFLRDVRALGKLQPDGPGVWRAAHLGRHLVLVSNREVPVERDSITVHLLVREPLESTRLVARQVASEKELWQLYAGWLATMFPDLYEEIRKMATSELGPIIDVRPIIKKLGMADVLRQLGVKEVVDALGVDAIADSLSPEQWEALLQRRQARQSGKGSTRTRARPRKDRDG
jgi:hypothetical protein